MVWVVVLRVFDVWRCLVTGGWCLVVTGGWCLVVTGGWWVVAEQVR